VKVGKLSPEKLQTLVLDKFQKRHPQVLLGAGLGEDAAIVDFGEDLCVVASDPITGAGVGMGRLAVHVACNDVAAAGATPIGIQVILLLPTDMPEEGIMELMAEIADTGEGLGIDIIGGHTEITSKVLEPLIVITALGSVPRDGYITSSGAQPGDDLVLSKGAGWEGTAILAHDFAHLLNDLTPTELQRAQGFLHQLSVIPEGRIGRRLKASAMHDVTEGGVLGALWEMAQASGVGFDLYRDRVPMARETRLICDQLGLDPLALISSGAMLFATSDGQALVEALGEQGIPGAIIGRVTAGELLVWTGQKKERLVGPPEDELWRFLAATGKDGS
jgi:hydrogenase expression/formation protein HypE